MNMNWDAAFAACKSYDDTEVSAALQTAVDAAGGLDLALFKDLRSLCSAPC